MEPYPNGGEGMAKITLRIETQLITWNEVAGFCFSRDSNRYSRTKKREQAFVKHEIEAQLEVKNYFKSNQTRVSYEWHTSGSFDLGNLAAGEKFIADSLNELGLWDDDRYIMSIQHSLVHDASDYVLVTVQNMPKRRKKAKEGE